MSSIKNPVGPQPPSVYWRRRLLLVLGLVAVIVVIVLIVVQPGRDATPSTQKTDSPAPGSSETSAPPSSNADGSCDPAALEVAAITDSASYGPEQSPQLSLSITNTGDEPCDYDVGPAAQLYQITSGADEIWKSSDCAQPADPNIVTLEPGVAQTTTPIPWDRTRSSTTTCETQRPAVTGGGATYRLSVSVGEAASAEDKPFLLQ